MRRDRRHGIQMVCAHDSIFAKANLSISVSARIPDSAIARCRAAGKYVHHQVDDVINIDIT